MDRLKRLLADARARRPLLDHLVRAFGRYKSDNGDVLAASVTYFWFLSLFPLVLLAVSLLGYVYGDQAAERVQDALAGVLPGALVSTLGATLEEAKGPAGVVGLVGLLYSGLGWIDALRSAIRTVWHQNVLAGNLVVQKLTDVVVLVGLFATLATSVVVTGLTTQAAGVVLDLLGVTSSPAARVLTAALAVALALLADVALFLYLFSRLARVRHPLRRLLAGAVFGAVGFELLKFGGGFYVARTTASGQATYGTFAVVVGLLLFLNLVSRFILISAAFVVTEPYDSDVAPSGTASPALADQAGIPRRFADDDPDRPPAVVRDGAPTPLGPALLGRGAPGDAPEEDAPTDDAARPGGVLAARVTAGAGAVLLGGLAWHLAGTVRRWSRD